MRRQDGIESWVKVGLLVDVVVIADVLSDQSWRHQALSVRVRDLDLCNTTPLQSSPL